MAGGFTVCEFRGQKAVKYYHNYGEFEFLLIQANDGTRDVVFHVTVPGMSKTAVRKIGAEALNQIQKTAKILRYDIKSDKPSFDDILHILDQAKRYMQEQKMSRRAQSNSTQVKA